MKKINLGCLPAKILPDALVSGFLCAVALTFVVRKSINVAVFLLGFYAIYWGWKNRKIVIAAPDFAKILVVAFSFPFFWSLLVDSVKHEFNSGQLDEYSRILLCVPILFFFLSHIQVKHFGFFKWVYALSFVGLCCVGWLIPTIWGGRFATYWVDPSVMGLAGCVGAGSLIYLATAEWLRKGSVGLCLVLSVGAAFATYVLYASGTRAAWFGFLGVCFAGILLPRKSLHRAAVSLIIVAILSLVYGVSASLRDRLDNTATDVAQWFSGTSLDGAIGQRLSITRAGFVLAAEAPLLGRTMEQLNDEIVRRAEALKLTPTASGAWVLAGTHNHLMEKMLTNGFIGLLAACGLLFIPLVFFWRHINSPDWLSRDASVLGFVICLSYFLYSFGNILTLKYVNAFYGGWVVTMASLILRSEAGHFIPTQTPHFPDNQAS